MIAWVVTLSAVLEVGRRPAVGCMAYVTLFSRIQMTVWLEALRDTAIKVTAITVIGRSRVVNPCAADEGSRLMAGATIQRGGKVSGVDLEIFTFCRNTIMTGCTTAHDTRMIKHSSNEGKR